MSKLSWEEKLQLINSLAMAYLKMLEPGKWQLSQSRVTMTADPLGEACTYRGKGSTPEEAVEDYWSKITSVESPGIIIVDFGSPDVRHLRWQSDKFQELPVR